MSIYRCASCGSSSIVKDSNKKAPGEGNDEGGGSLFGRLKSFTDGRGSKEGKSYYHCVACGQTFTYCMSEYTKEELDIAIRSNNIFTIKKLKEQYPHMDYDTSTEKIN